jgi:hypothetical protein
LYDCFHKLLFSTVRNQVRKKPNPPAQRRVGSYSSKTIPETGAGKQVNRSCYSGTISVREIYQHSSPNAKTPHLEFETGRFCKRSRRRPTLPHSYPCSTIGPEGLNFRVRDGNGCDPLGIATEKLLRGVRSERVRGKSL